MNSAVSSHTNLCPVFKHRMLACVAYPTVGAASTHAMQQCVSYPLMLQGMHISVPRYCVVILV